MASFCTFDQNRLSLIFLAGFCLVILEEVCLVMCKGLLTSKCPFFNSFVLFLLGNSGYLAVLQASGSSAGYLAVLLVI